MLLQLLNYRYLLCILSVITYTLSIGPNMPFRPSSQPTVSPTMYPNCIPTVQPSVNPSCPSTQPSRQPKRQPSNQPTEIPTYFPTNQPTRLPSDQPTFLPIHSPSSQPSKTPSVQPFQNPSKRPSKRPTTQPTKTPVRKPSSQPSARPKRYPTKQPFRKPTSQPSIKPRQKPSLQPTRQPSSQPSIQPFHVPSMQPSLQPYRFPTVQPSVQPIKRPSKRPSLQPSNQPFLQPSMRPSQQPSRQPVLRPSAQPKQYPSTQPSKFPSCQPTGQPFDFPTGRPTLQPLMNPTHFPSIQPSKQPIKRPSVQPSSDPSRQPRTIPTVQPSCQPIRKPTRNPSKQPSSQPRRRPTRQPSSQPIKFPTSHPSVQPTRQPSKRPFRQPSRQPSKQPTLQPKAKPTNQPFHYPSPRPSINPSYFPTFQPTIEPSCSPSHQPNHLPSRVPSSQPTMQPSNRPGRYPSSHPSGQPFQLPTVQPSYKPSFNPSSQPAKRPTRQPSVQPTNQPSKRPTRQPSRQPLRTPSQQPQKFPSQQPFRKPSQQPSRQPNFTPSCQPGKKPSRSPTKQPFCRPTVQPWKKPSRVPTFQPLKNPTKQPLSRPSIQPSLQSISKPTRQPQNRPSIQPSAHPSVSPSSQPNHKPTNQPLKLPSKQPISFPSMKPSSQPIKFPTKQPSSQPISRPSCTPTVQPVNRYPTVQPSRQPSRRPTKQPFRRPSAQPIHFPSRLPSCQPLRHPTVQPSKQPLRRPTNQITLMPTSQPLQNPTAQPKFAYPSNQPTMRPSSQPLFIKPTAQPVLRPSSRPTKQPSISPTEQPSRQPRMRPSCQPTFQPIYYPSKQPSIQPTKRPSIQPSKTPLHRPSSQPVSRPSSQPFFAAPTTQPFCRPSCQPSRQPLLRPTKQPSRQPSGQPFVRHPSSIPSQQPTDQPTRQPLKLPSSQPTRNPTIQPARKPTRNPSMQPNNARPTSQPNSCPSCQPKRKPSAQPFRDPTTQPNFSPSVTPTKQPFKHPSNTPSSQPTYNPSKLPTCQPSKQPLQRRPTAQPTFNPTVQPTKQPSKQPSLQPTRQPSSQPSIQPLNDPTEQPSCQPRKKPSRQPTIKPSLQSASIPTMQPQRSPTRQPTKQPSSFPTSQPFSNPTRQPTQQPFQRYPTCQPKRTPTTQPTFQPKRSPSSQPLHHPTFSPTSQPLLHSPSKQPKQSPTAQPVLLNPSLRPSLQPLKYPTVQPRRVPTDQPSRNPIRRPSIKPTHIPSMQPSQKPSKQPSVKPSKVPVKHPSLQPNRMPSAQPTRKPLRIPSLQPYLWPTIQPSHYPTNVPTNQPNKYPSLSPSKKPSKQPVHYPTRQPTRQPSRKPINRPTRNPFSKPSSQPTCTPVSRPSSQPNRLHPSRQPSSQPSKQPIKSPTRQPSIQPYIHPIAKPSRQPRRHPSSQPLMRPTVSPSQQPSAQPSSYPKQRPTFQPSKQPQRMPSKQPNRKPSRRPSVQPTSQPRQRPTRKPSSQPTNQPLLTPTQQPQHVPTAQPLLFPSIQPLVSPTCSPTTQPSSRPRCRPSLQPYSTPSKQPTYFPIKNPSSQPSLTPSKRPSTQPVASPTRQPTKQPHRSPSIQPSKQPTRQPYVKRPTIQPSKIPSKQPNFKPSRRPSKQPTSRPSYQPRLSPTCQPTMQPTFVPSLCPSVQPFKLPTCQPGQHPTRIPTYQPTSVPRRRPTKQPRCNPTRQPSLRPKDLPTAQPRNLPTKQPSQHPYSHPSIQPRRNPSRLPTVQPISRPSCLPFHSPSGQPSSQPRVFPSKRPTNRPTLQPTTQPRKGPTCQPRSKPTCLPSKQPVINHPTTQPIGRRPSSQPFKQPSKQPVGFPTNQPIVCHPSVQPSMSPSICPTTLPSQPSSQPSQQPSQQPTLQHSSRPTSQPRRLPSSQPSLIPSIQTIHFPSSQPSQQPAKRPTLQPNRKPSSSPSLRPSGQPSLHPIRKPSSQPRSKPTRQPSRQPILKPTYQPSVQPSMQPTTSNPTGIPTEYPTETFISNTPTPRRFLDQNPTSHPSIGLSYLNSTIYKAFQKTLSMLSTQTNSTIFQYFYYKGKVVSGSCLSWQLFTDNSLSISSGFAEYSRIVIDFASSNFISTQSSSLHASCGSQRTVSSIINSVQQKKSFAANCDGNLWRVISCSSSVILCVNCKNTCSRTPNCPGLSFSLNPCGSCNTDAAEMVVARFEYTQPLLYPQFFQVNGTGSPLAVSSNAKYVIVSANISRPGVVYCAAFPYSSTVNVSSVLAIKLRGVNAVVTSFTGSWSPVQLNISNLSPDTGYDVLCYTEDFAMHAMPLQTALMTRTRVVTNCCKRIEIINLDTYIPQYLSPAASWNNQLQQIQLNAPPIAETTVVLAIVGCNGLAAPTGDSTWPVAQPSQFTFPPNIQQLTGSFRIRGSRLGCYTLSATALGGVYSTVSANFSIQNVRVKPPAPIMNSVSFSPDGTNLLINFDSSTDCGSNYYSSKSVNCQSTFRCSSVVLFSGSNNSFCSWATNKLLIAYLNLGTSQFSLKTFSALLPSIGQSCTLRASVIQPLCNAPVDCSSVSTSQPTTLVIQVPLNPLLPSPRITVPSFVYPCNDVYIDPRTSSGSGGRPWQYIQWSAYGVDLNSLSQVTPLPIISNNLNANYGGNFRSLSAFYINSDLLSLAGLASGNYSFLRLSLTLTNFLLQSAVVTSDVKIVLSGNKEDGRFTPQVGIYTTFNGIVYPWQKIDFLAVVSSITSSHCNVFNSTKSATSILKYSWKVFNSDGSGNIRFISMLSTSSGPFFSIPPYSLEPATTYIVQLFTAMSNNSFDSMLVNYPAATVLTTGRSGIQAVISGGDTRSTSSFNDVNFDASSSYDIDFPRSGSSMFSFTWTCSVISPAVSFGKNCFSAINIVDVSNPVLNIPAGVLSSGSYNITILVSRANSDSTTVSDTAYSTLTILNLEKIGSFQIQRIGVSNPSPSSSLSKFNAGDNIYFAGSISGMTKMGYGNWSVVEKNAASSSLTLLSPSVKVISPGSSIFQFAVSTANSLLLNQLTFQLSICYAASSSCATSTVVLTRNVPPRGGVLSVSPPLGIAMSTAFKLSTLFWNDDVEDYPLQYLMGYYVMGISNLNTVKNYNFLSSVTTFLGAGVSSAFYSLQCIVVAMDSNGGYGNTTTLATVTPGTASQSQVKAISIRAIDSTFQISDYSSFYSTVSAALSLINRADCSTVPVPCYKLNRMECFSTPGTCGSCLSGFNGRIGDSNLACNVSLTSTGSPCIADKNCATGLCSNRICSEPMKICSKNCNGNGVCQYKTYNGLFIKNCFLSDGSCYASCSCNANFLGKDCSLNAPQYQSLVSYRERLCVKLLAAVENEQATTDEDSSDKIATRANTVISIFSDYSQISITAVNYCAQALNLTTIRHPTNACYKTAASAVVQAFSSIFQTVTYLYPTNVGSLNGILQMMAYFSTGFQNQMIAGQLPLQFSYDSLRTYIAIVDASVASYSYTMPQLSWYSSLNIQSPQIKIIVPNISSPLQQSLSIYSSIFNRPNFTFANMSSSIHTELSLHAIANSAMRRLSTSPTTLSFTSLIELPNKSPVYYISLASSNLTFYCQYISSAPYKLNGTCPNGQIIRNIICPGNARGRYDVLCPGYATFPKCKLWKQTSYVDATSCRVSSFSSYSTKCSCKFSISPSMTVEFEVATDLASQMYGDRPVTSFTAYTSSSVSKENQSYRTAVWATLSALFLVFLIGCIRFVYVDVKESKAIAKSSDVAVSKSQYRTVHTYLQSCYFDSPHWQMTGWEMLRTKHPLLRLYFWNVNFNLFDRLIDFQYKAVVNWVVAMASILSTIFYSVVVLRIYSLLDDQSYRTCGNIALERDCRRDLKCSFDSASGICNYSYSPSVEVTIQLVLVITAFCVVNANVVQFLIESLVTNYSTLMNAIWQLRSTVVPVVVTDIDASSEGINMDEVEMWASNERIETMVDEFASLQSKKKTLLLLGARLAKLNHVADYSLPLEESSSLLNIWDDIMNRDDMEAKRKAHRFIGSTIVERFSYPLFYLFDPKIYPFNTWIIFHRVIRVRKSTDVLIHLLRTMEDSAKEMILVKVFSIQFFGGFKRLIMQRLLLTDTSIPDRAARQKKVASLPSLILHTACFFFLLGLWSFMVYYIYSQFTNLRSSLTIRLLIIIALSTYFEDILFLQSLSIWVEEYFPKFLVRDALKQRMSDLSAVGRVVLARSSGFMTFSNSFGKFFLVLS